MRVRLCRGESGQAVVEYALVLMFVAAGLLLALVLLGPDMRSSYGRIDARMQAPAADIGRVAGDTSTDRPTAEGPAVSGARAGGPAAQSVPEPTRGDE
jgi:Flp pilus assembly pilin Flp